MEKFVVLVNNDGYRKYTRNAAIIGGAYVPAFKNRLIKRAFEIHNSERMNRLVELPFKWIWYKVCMGGKYSKQDELYLVCYESFHMSYSRKFLKYVKRTYKKCKTVFLFSNPVCEYNMRRLMRIRDLYDEVFTFNREDAVNNGFIYCKEEGFVLPVLGPIEKLTSDVFFVGSDKGRLGLLHSIYEYLSKNGVLCNFYIVGVPKEKQIYKGIKYNQTISYEEVLENVKGSRCILEVLQNNQCYMSLRTAEAIQYHKKLLTTNLEIVDSDVYNPNIIQTVNKAEDIDVNFIKREISADLYKDLNIGDFEKFKEFVIKTLRKSEHVV